jgi:indolepyruvate ferredoxin oxidoreductase
VRGTAFDPFGYTPHRRLERSLIPWFEEIVDALLKNLSVASVPAAIDDVQQIIEIRGYGPVKEVAIEGVKRRIERRS